MAWFTAPTWVDFQVCRKGVLLVIAKVEQDAGADTANAVRISAAGLAQRLPQVGHEVVGMLEAHRQPNQALVDAKTLAHFG